MRRVVVLAFCALAGGSEVPAVLHAALLPALIGVYGDVTVEPNHNPLPGALVTLTMPSGSTRVDVTDERGRFGFSDLAPGVYSLKAIKAAYVSAGVGEPSISAGAAVRFDGGNSVRDVHLVLVKGAVIAGAVRDLAGMPAAGVQVTLSGAVVSTSTVTDDQGAYRFFGLPKGSYKVSATPRLGPERQFTSPSSADNDVLIADLRRSLGTGLAVGLGTPQSAQSLPTSASPVGRETNNQPLALAPVYFPGTPEVSQAVALDVASAQELTGVDFQLVLAGTTRIHGIVTRSDGRPGSGLRVAAVVLGARSGLPPLTGIAAADGTFTLANVIPGHYRVYAIARDQLRDGQVTPSLPAQQEWATADVAVNGELTGVMLSLRAPLKLSGRLALESTTTSRKLSGITVVLTPAMGQLITHPLKSAVAADGTFETVGLLPGSYAISVETGSLGYWLRSVKAGDAELLDAPLTLEDHDLTDIVVHLSDKRTSVTGRLVFGAQEPGANYVVAIFPVDRNLWNTARRLAVSAVASDGTYAVKDLPAGEYFLAVAHADGFSDLWPSFDCLAMLSSSAMTIALGDGQQLVRDVRVSNKF